MDLTSSHCGACAYRRNRCHDSCPLAPYFMYPESIKDYDAVHRCFGQRNFLRLIEIVPKADRQQTVNSLVFEATSRLRDPVSGCVSYFLSLERQIKELKEQVEKLQDQVSEKSLKQHTDSNLHPGSNFANDNPDPRRDVHQTSLDHNLALTNLPKNTSSPSFSVSSPTYIPHITSGCSTCNDPSL